ncbi:unnamed protein product [Rangifer tarandus platyrhynchus]|uniref:Uncharacterized protein n=1 Tax=Rangifer tarandus platyrhynchus TaxID=3082113 RepID=A0AC59YA05_RANTA
MKIWGKEEQKRDTEAKIQTHNKCMDTKGGSGDGMNREMGIDIYTVSILCINSGLMRTYIQHRELYSMVCSNLNGEEIQNFKQRDYTYTYGWFTLLQQKLTQHCKEILNQENVLERKHYLPSYSNYMTLYRRGKTMEMGKDQVARDLGRGKEG